MKSVIFALAAAVVSVSATRAHSKRAQPVYAQCGGNGFTGNTECAAGSSCVAQSEWYSQCLPGTSSSSSSVKTTISVATTSTVVTSKASVTSTSTTTSKATVSSTTGKASATGSAGYSPKSGIYPFGQTQKAIATTYGGNWPGGMCSLGDYPHAGLNGVALGKQQWFGAAGCGSCINITGSSGSVVAMVNDQCPECVDNHLDLDNSYADQVDTDWATKGIFDIQWTFVPCPVEGKLQFKNKEGTSAYYFALQVRNSALPVDTLEVSKDNGAIWTKVDRSDYNYFTSYSGFGDVVDVRVTASTGAQVIEKGIKVSSGSIVTGTQQFSA